MGAARQSGFWRSAPWRVLCAAEANRACSCSAPVVYESGQSAVCVQLPELQLQPQRAGSVEGRAHRYRGMTSRLSPSNVERAGGKTSRPAVWCRCVPGGPAAPSSSTSVLWLDVMHCGQGWHTVRAALSLSPSHENHIPRSAQNGTRNSPCTPPARAHSTVTYGDAPGTQQAGTAQRRTAASGWARAGGPWRAPRSVSAQVRVHACAAHVTAAHACGGVDRGGARRRGGAVHSAGGCGCGAPEASTKAVKS